ncbi:DUF2332 domain-containing protein [Phenylobacterium deserti]|uniref:DUF2332 domain-containing protein n=1 Tax=Phenylobacterium deserti TaxID=1914756 RepID=A0A328AU18_9CAUL|nr:DUF2332 family protein [Phenylobacterium deserti]RAK57014.1 DUF2332 domain-containing protein [Phenylobacterium deserti]
MKMLQAAGAEHAFARQAQNCRSAGSTFVASVLEAVDRQLPHAPLSHEFVRAWKGDPAAGAIALRVNGALHALARRGKPKYLADLYSGAHEDFDGAVADALSQEDQFIAEWIRHPTQTNEVARGAAIMAALLSVAAQRRMPFEILELGSSCGLNLNLDRYAYELGTMSVGDASSSVHIAPKWTGPNPPDAFVSIVAARGVDLSPLNARNPAHRERLLSFTWADQPDRSRRLEAALRQAVTQPPRVDQGDAGQWLAERLAEAQPKGVCRAVVHSMFLQYLSEDARRSVAATLAGAGAEASLDRPLIEIGLEWTTDRREVQLRLTTWPTGQTSVLARTDPYGEWVEWLAD